MLKHFLIIKKMNNLTKNLFCLFTILIALGACQNVRDGLTGKKKSNSDEFLVQKKFLNLPKHLVKPKENLKKEKFKEIKN